MHLAPTPVKDLAGAAKVSIDQARSMALGARPGAITSEELEKENLDVEKLEKVSLSGLLYTILGKKEEKES